MLVCHCHRVSDAAVAELLDAGASRVAHLVRGTQAGTGCGGCLPELRRMCQQAAMSRTCQAHPEGVLASA